MLGKKLSSIKGLAKMVSVKAAMESEPSKYKSLPREQDGEASAAPTPAGFFAVYVGEELQRFVVPTGYLSHPLFKILLEKASDEFGFEQESGLVFPCSVPAFQQVVNAVECCNCSFKFGDEFI